MTKSKKQGKPSAPKINIEWNFDDAGWKSYQAFLKNDVALLIERAAKKKKYTFTVLCTNDKTIKKLNRDFRGKNKPTNVLSFPNDDENYLGDIALAIETIKREAKALKKPMKDYLAHLALHGFLHLLGYDHMTDTEAKEMEALETKILTEYGYTRPYE
ncbi:MAG: rRNA maturation RNase YbeY [Alphaproteobacteria bacterium]|nr:rRNA maturation RNase YbeY [Alphaproteobacteria bacterium]